jgi:hypothetical protein
MQRIFWHDAQQGKDGNKAGHNNSKEMRTGVLILVATP